MPALAVPLAISAPAAARSSCSIVRPCSSSTPGVAPAMTSRAAASRAGQVRRHRVGVHVVAAPRRRSSRCSPRPAGSRPAPRSSSRRGQPLPIGRPTNPRSRHRAVGAGVRRRRVHDAPPGVRAGQTDRLAARRIDRRDEPRVDRAGEHLDDHRQRGRHRSRARRRPAASRCRRASARHRSRARRRARRRAGRPPPRGRSPPPARACGPAPPAARRRASAPSSRASREQPRALVEPERDVEVLHGLTGGALQQVVEDRHDDEAAASPRRASSRCRRSSCTRPA